jgi:predicted HicB family RNase H-like nuclease
MKYKGYQGHVIYDDEANLFHGEVIGLRDVITFQGLSVDELNQAFKDSIDEYIEFCKELGRPAEKPMSGKILLRISPEEHERAFCKAKSNGLSVNTWIKRVLHDELFPEDPPVEKTSLDDARSLHKRIRKSQKLQEA